MNEHITGKDLKQSEGGATITLGGKDYIIAMDFNAICDLEEKYGSFEKATMVLESIGSDFSKPGAMKNIRFILCVMLRHTDDEMTERKAGKLLTMDNMQQIMDTLGKAMCGTTTENNDPKKVESPQEI